MPSRYESDESVFHDGDEIDFWNGEEENSVRSMFTATFNPKRSSAVSMGVSRYPVVNSGRHLSEVFGAGASKIAKASMCSLGKEFQNLIDGNKPVKNSQLEDLERPFNEHMDNLIRQGEDPLDIMNYLEKECGIRRNILHEMRQRLYWNNVTGLTAYGGTTMPPYTPPPPPPPPTNPPVASVDRYFPKERPKPPPPAPVSSTDQYIPLPTGSEQEPFWIPTVEQPPPPPPPPPVATPSVGCWYVMGKGYVWGPRPSGGESTGLNQSDCEAIKARDLEIRQPQMTQQVSCDPMRGQFFDPRTGQCRGSVSSFPGAPFGLPGGAGSVSAPSLSGRRRPNYGNGNLEWWSYQQSFLPQLFFTRRRAHYATLGAGKPVPPGICCQATEDGGAICSTGQGFPPTCPNKPEPNVPGVASYVQQGGYMVPKPPAAPVGGVCAAGPVETAPPKSVEGSSLTPVLGIAAVGALLYAVVEGLV